MNQCDSLSVAVTQVCMCPIICIEFVMKCWRRWKQLRSIKTLNLLWENQLGSLLYSYHWDKSGLAKKKKKKSAYDGFCIHVWQNACTHYWAIRTCTVYIIVQSVCYRLYFYSCPVIIFKDVLGLIFVVDLCCIFFSFRFLYFYWIGFNLLVFRACYGVLRFVMESGAKGCEVCKGSFWPPLTVKWAFFFLLCFLYIRVSFLSLYPGYS